MRNLILTFKTTIMAYWWQSLNPLKRLGMKGQAILYCDSTGCQAMHDFKWLGKIVGFEKNEKGHEDILIQIVIHNHSYGDSRDTEEVELYRYPLVNADIQEVDGVWILFT